MIKEPSFAEKSLLPHVIINPTNIYFFNTAIVSINFEHILHLFLVFLLLTLNK